MQEYTILINHPVPVTVKAESYDAAISMIRAQYHIPLSEPFFFTLVQNAESETSSAETLN